jgi:glycosyltransferase involved in cell wall biosynthesis
MPHDQALPIESKSLKRWITLFFYRFFTSIRVINQEEKSLLDSYGIRAEIIPIAISQEFFHELTLPRKDIVFVGNLYHDKNPEFLIETMKILQKS